MTPHAPFQHRLYTNPTRPALSQIAGRFPRVAKMSSKLLCLLALACVLHHSSGQEFSWPGLPVDNSIEHSAVETPSENDEALPEEIPELPTSGETNVEHESSESSPSTTVHSSHSEVCPDSVDPDSDAAVVGFKPWSLERVQTYNFSDGTRCYGRGEKWDLDDIVTCYMAYFGFDHQGGFKGCQRTVVDLEPIFELVKHYSGCDLVNEAENEKCTRRSESVKLAESQESGASSSEHASRFWRGRRTLNPYLEVITRECSVVGRKFATYGAIWSLYPNRPAPIRPGDWTLKDSMGLGSRGKFSKLWDNLEPPPNLPSPATRARFSAFWLRSKFSNCSYRLNLR